MRFPFTFSRGKNTAGFLAIGSDSAPVVNNGVALPPASYASKGNVFSHKTSSINGWPCHRIGMIVQYFGAGSPPATLPVTMYLWEEVTQNWHKIAAVKNIVPNQLTFFDTIGALDTHGVPQGGDPWANQLPGNESLFILVADNAGADGEYRFACVADLTVAGA